MPKRLIQDVLPLGELNKYAQKGGAIRSLNVMHPRATIEAAGARSVDPATMDAEPNTLIKSWKGALK